MILRLIAPVPIGQGHNMARGPGTIYNIYFPLKLILRGEEKSKDFIHLRVVAFLCKRTKFELDPNP